MNEKRQQDYLDLIQNLLNCRSGEEIQEILAVNQELMDAGFLQMLEVVAEVKSESGQENTANWLRNLVMNECHRWFWGWYFDQGKRI